MENKITVEKVKKIKYQETYGCWGPYDTITRSVFTISVSRDRVEQRHYAYYDSNHKPFLREECDWVKRFAVDHNKLFEFLPQFLEDFEKQDSDVVMMCDAMNAEIMVTLVDGSQHIKLVNDTKAIDEFLMSEIGWDPQED